MAGAWRDFGAPRIGPERGFFSTSRGDEVTVADRRHELKRVSSSPLKSGASSGLRSG